MLNLKEKLPDDIVIGSWINSGSTIVAELMSSQGFDFLCVDVEHSPVDVSQTFSMFQAIKSGNQNCKSLVRLHGVDYRFVKRYLDAGADGVIAPLVNNSQQVSLLIEATKFPPIGKRGVGFCRANKYGQSLSEYVDNANNEILLAIQIEDKLGVENIEEILSVNGIDAVFIGPYDLSASLGVTAQFDHPDYIAARDHVLDVCNSKGITAGIHVVNPDPNELLERINEGYKLLAYSLDITFLTSKLNKDLSFIHQNIQSL